MTLSDTSDVFDNYLIEPLDKQDRAAFSCGVEPLDRYLKQQAGQDARKRMAAPFVLIEKSSSAVVGYYTLSSTTIIFGELSTEITKKLPKYPNVPATLLGRLAVDKKYRGRRLGEMLLMDALHRSFYNEIATIAVVVDVKDDQARSFYEHFDFIQFPNFPYRLFLLMDTIAKVFE
ncbi:GNAT family N-acetyltransferase [Nostoc sp. B(2019)]|nr:GNAT family N-acetyltransferase [Nostoc sp. B(2019)]